MGGRSFYFQHPTGILLKSSDALLPLRAKPFNFQFNDVAGLQVLRRLHPESRFFRLLLMQPSHS